MLEGHSGVGPITAFDASAFTARIAGEVSGFDVSQWMGRKDARKMDRFIHLAIAATEMALADAGLSSPVPDPERTGVLVGVGLGGIGTIEAAHEIYRTRGPKRLSPFMIPRLIANMAPGNISIRIGAQGPNLSSVSACATGAHSVGDAARLIAMGDADVMVAGGAEATITPLGVGGFAAMRALSTRNDDPTTASRPFDAGRDGFVCAEGAGVLILETYERAKARGARIYAELAGYGQSSDAYHMTLPHPDGRGAKAAMRNALADAELPLEAIDYVNAHGTSTPHGDIAESRAIRAVFGTHADALWVSSTKSMTGHMLGAAGAVEAAVCCLSIAKGQVPPTINLHEPDPECTLDYVPNVARSKPVGAALTNSFGFGGTNVSLVFKGV
jgi:3-oxoacyl-[acyl-carrier-protein] synthase II